MGCRQGARSRSRAAQEYPLLKQVHVRELWDGQWQVEYVDRHVTYHATEAEARAAADPAAAQDYVRVRVFRYRPGPHVPPRVG